MKKFDIVKKIAVGNFTVSLVKDSEALIYTTTPTETNDGGVMLAYVDPLHDKMLYATCRQLFDMVCDGDAAGEALLLNYCISVLAVRGCVIVDGQCLSEVTSAVKSMYVRVKGETDKAGDAIGVKEETSEEALAKMKEEEEILNM